MIRNATEQDRQQVLAEIERLKKMGRSFVGKSLDEQLGIDAWVMRVGAVDEREKKLKRKATKK